MKWRFLISAGLFGALAIGTSIFGHARRSGDRVVELKPDAPSLVVRPGGSALSLPHHSPRAIGVTGLPLASNQRQQTAEMAVHRSLAEPRWSFAAYMRTSAPLKLDMPCSQYIILPDECYDEAAADGGYGNDSYYHPYYFPYPAYFFFYGTIGGHPVVGTAYRNGTGSSYSAAFTAIGGSSCWGTILADLSVGEALLIELGFPSRLTSWRVTTSSNCD